VEEPATSSSTTPFLYVFRGNAADATVLLKKIDLRNATFGLDLGEHEFTTLTQPGQPARYQGNWHFPAAGTTLPRKLTTVGTGSVTTDTLTGPTGSGGAANAEHLANVSFQISGHRSGSGVRVLKLDGDPQTEVDWGEYFPAGDKEERALALKSLGGLTFVLNKDGVYSFNAKGRSRLIFEDFRTWRDVFDNLPMSAFRSGLIISHPSALLYYIPGEQPVNIGIEVNQGLLSLPPSGPTELHGGRYHSTAIAGDFIYTTYQPVITSSTALLLVAYPRREDPTDLVWQGLGDVTLNDSSYLSGTYVAVNGLPVDSSVPRPTVWSGFGSEVRHMTLDPRGSPFRARADVHRVTLSADAYMSELRFTEPVDLTGVVVQTSADMVSGDEWQASLLINGSGDDLNVGPPAAGSSTRHVRTLDRKNVRSAVLHIKWTGTSTADRVPPVLHSVELFGRPSIGDIRE
ncbi:hypothetical protein LCGC14_2556970, partial [marine sediment metagenome]